MRAFLPFSESERTLQILAGLNPLASAALLLAWLSGGAAGSSATQCSDGEGQAGGLGELRGGCGHGLSVNRFSFFSERPTIVLLFCLLSYRKSRENVSFSCFCNPSATVGLTFPRLSQISYGTCL